MNLKVLGIMHQYSVLIPKFYISELDGQTELTLNPGQAFHMPLTRIVPLDPKPEVIYIAPYARECCVLASARGPDSST